MKNKILIIYIVLFMGIAALPFYGMLFYNSNETIGNEEEVKRPSIKNEDRYNLSYLNDVGNYFEKKMAFRDVMISAQTRLLSDVFCESVNDQVIVGKNGWLYYADSMDDYRGINLLSDRALYNIAYNIYRMQEYVERQGGKFVFTVAPNKNSLYPANMPYYNKAKFSEEKNIEHLIPYLEKLGVNYVDLFSVFNDQDEVLYHATDSHWNNKGAVLAYNTILDAIEKKHETYESISYEEKADFVGDLEEMLHPRDQKAENEIYYNKEFSYKYVNEIESTFDPLIYTQNSKAENSLIMYRDSFGNALVPFMADEFENAEFSRAEPYFLCGDYASQKADTVIVERAERFLHNVGENPATIKSIGYWMDKGFETVENETSLEVGEVEDDQVYLRGVLDPSLVDNDTEIYLRVNDEYGYEASPMTTEDGNDYGYSCFFLKEQIPYEDAKIEVLAVKDTGTYILGRFEVSVNENTVKRTKPGEKEVTVEEKAGYKELGKVSEGTQTYHIFNKTGKVIKEIYVTEAESEEFGKNLLSKNTIKNNEEFLLNCPKIEKKDDVGKYWIKVIYEDKSEGIFKNLTLKNATFVEMHQDGEKYSYIRYQNNKNYKIENNKEAVVERVKAEEEAARKAREEAERRAREEAARKAREEAAKKAAQKAAKNKKKSSSSSEKSSNSGGKHVVRKEKIYDCDGSGRYYTIYHWSDGTTTMG